MPVPDFSPGEVLTASAMDSIGLWLVKTQTIGTAVSSVTVSNAFSSNYDAYKIFIAGGTASADCNIGLSLGASGTGYYSAGVVYTYAAGAGQVITDNNGSSWSRAAQADVASIHMDVTIMDPWLSKKTKINYVYALPSTDISGGMAAGFHNVEASYTAFTLTPSGGATLTGGTIRVYGYRN